MVLSFITHDESRYRGMAVNWLVALTLVGGRAGSARAEGAPAAALVEGGEAVKDCWAAAQPYKDQSTARWTAGDGAGALAARLEVLRQTARCSTGTSEQWISALNTFESVLVQVLPQGAIALNAADAQVVHDWYQSFTVRDTAIEISSSFLTMYGEFERHTPPAPARPEKPHKQTPSAAETAPQQVDQPGLPPEKLPRTGQTMRISGAVLLTTGIGAVVTGLLSVRTTLTAQGDLNRECSPTCDPAEVAQLVARGQLHEKLAPAFLATGIAFTAAGSVLLAVGIKRKRANMAMVPVLHPRFAGLSWALRF